VASASGIDLAGSNNTIGPNNVISANLLSGVRFSASTASNNTVKGNKIGTDNTGTQPLGNGIGTNNAGVTILVGTGNTIGGSTAADRNIISANVANGISLQGGVGGNFVIGNYIGTDVNGAAGTPPLGNGFGPSGATSASVRVDTANNTITGNVISGGAAAGININASGTIVQGNKVGTNAAGTAAVPNATEGINVAGSNNTIGGTNPGDGNLLSGNTNRGLFLIGNGNTARGNLIGTNAAGTAALPNKWFGIQINGNNNTVGGTTAAARNVISGNGFDTSTRSGISFFSTATGNVVQGNFIGTDVNGTSGIGNAAEGIFFAGTTSSANPSSNVIGGVAAGAGNVIAFNNSNGVTLMPGPETGNAIRGNSIFSNTGGPGLGIDVGGGGVTANDPGDGDTGPNNFQNWPVLSTATIASGTITIGGSLNSTASTIFDLDFFASSSCDPSGNGEGQVFLGTSPVTTDGAGNITFSQAFAFPNGIGNTIAATATDPAGNTSEFSNCLSQNQVPTATADAKSTNEDAPLAFPAGDLVANDDPGAGDAGQTLTVSQVSATGLTHGTVTLASGTITYSPAGNFNGPASFTYQVCDNGTTNGAPDPMCATGTVNVTVLSVNDTPVTADDSATAVHGVPATIAVLGNDTDVDNDTLTVQSVTTPAHGTASVDLNTQTVTYTTTGPFAAADSFDYTVSDGHGGIATGHVTVAVTGKLAIVANRSSDTVSVIDWTTNTLTSTLTYPPGSTLMGATVTPDGQLGLVAEFNPGIVGVIDLASQPPVTSPPPISVATTPNPESTAVTPDGRYVLVADGGGATSLSSFDLQTRSLVNTVSGMPIFQAIAITPDGTLALLMGANSNQVAVLTMSNAGVLADTGQRITLAGTAGGPRSIAITPNGKLALVTDNVSNLVSVLSITGGNVALAASIATGGNQVTGVAVTPNGLKAYVSSQIDSKVAVLSINPSTNVVTDTGVRVTIPSGTPSGWYGVPGLAVTPDGSRLYIAAGISNRVSVLDTSTDTVVATITVGSQPTGIGMPGRR